MRAQKSDVKPECLAAAQELLFEHWLARQEYPDFEVFAKCPRRHRRFGAGDQALDDEDIPF